MFISNFMTILPVGAELF